MRKVPIHVKPRTDSEDAPSTEEALAQESEPVGMTVGEQRDIGSAVEPGKGKEDLDMWRDRALRLQAERENYRKRQRRLAEEQVVANRERMLRAFLGVADDLARALNAHEADAASLRQGVAMTYRNLQQALDREGVQAVVAKGEPFDPTWHEAVGTVRHQDAGVKPQTVIDVMEEGYRLGDRVLRPARVIVAV